MERRQISFKLEGISITEQSVPFKLLANVLNGIQNTFYCIGMEVAGKEPKVRGRIPAEILQACELRRVIEKPGSYEVVAEVTNRGQENLFNSDLGIIVRDKYLELLTHLNSMDIDGIRRIFPDSLHRRRILRSMISYCPREGDEWMLKFTNHNMEYKMALTRDIRQKISESLNPANVEMLTITGELMRLHLDEHKIAIYYLPTRRILDCYYDIELEDFIIGNLKGLIQVIGRVQLDSSGEPDKIIDVVSINELDLSTVTLSKISASGVNLELREPLILEPLFKEQEVVLEWPHLYIIASGITREDAICAFEEDFVWLWKEYVQVNEDNLSRDALRLKESILLMIKE